MVKQLLAHIAHNSLTDNDAAVTVEEGHPGSAEHGEEHPARILGNDSEIFVGDPFVDDYFDEVGGNDSENDAD